MDELRDWVAPRGEAPRSRPSDGREEPLPPLQYAVEHKFDGLTINLTYENGQLVQAGHPRQRRGRRGHSRRRRAPFAPCR